MQARLNALVDALLPVIATLAALAGVKGEV